MNSDIMHFSTDKTHIDEICMLMQKHQFQSIDEYKNLNTINAQLLFHINLIKVLIACTIGKNTFTVHFKTHFMLLILAIHLSLFNSF
jgi:hypothetical protein